MTPEEKLLALIQQEKTPAVPVAESPKAISPVVPAPVASTEKVAAVEKAPALEAGGVSAKSVSSPAVKPDSVAQKEEKVVVAPLPDKTEKKLKLASPAPVPAEAASVSVSPGPQEAAPVSGKELVAEVSVDKIVTPSSGYRMPIFRRRQSSGLELFNRVLAGVVLVLLVAVVYSIASIKADVTSAEAQLESGVVAQPVVAATIINEPLPSVDVYLEKLKDRNVFLPNDAVVTTSAVAVLTGKVADLKLLGVSIDSAVEEESMAIIRNKAESRTYFVKKGQMVGDTGYSLERVLSDRAILKKGKQEIELK